MESPDPISKPSSNNLFTWRRIRIFYLPLALSLVINFAIYLFTPETFTDAFQNLSVLGIFAFFGRCFFVFTMIGVYTIIGMLIFNFREIFLANKEELQKDITQLTAQEEFIEAKQRAREKPEDPAAAWDVAASQLQQYLNINLKQIESIYQLSLRVMMIGFFLIVVAIVLAFISPQNSSPALVAGIGGIVTEFIGGTFLFVYRAALEQSRHYIQTLDKTSTVGVALKILEGLEKKGDAVKEVREARVAIAKLLISQREEKE